MGKMSRNKGQRGERELASLLNEALQRDDVQRNLDQVRNKGGQDILDVPGFAFEVKRVEKPQIAAWWKHLANHVDDELEPVLAYRLNRRPWRFIVASSFMWDIPFQRDYPLGYTVEMSWDLFRELLVERVASLGANDV